MDNWDEIRTAFQVARLGTVSGAADVLGVHHATVIRHIDALEGRLGVKLFQRHAAAILQPRPGRTFCVWHRPPTSNLRSLPGASKGAAMMCRASWS